MTKKVIISIRQKTLTLEAIILLLGIILILNTIGCSIFSEIEKKYGEPIYLHQNYADPSYVKEQKRAMGYTTLFYAAEAGDISLVKKRIANGDDVNTKLSNGLTPLHLAAQFGHVDVVKELIANGADANAITDTDIEVDDYTKDGYGYIQKIKRIIYHIEAGSTVQYIAARNKHNDVLKELVSLNQNMDNAAAIKNFNKQMESCTSRFIKKPTREQIEQKVEIEIPNKQSRQFIETVEYVYNSAIEEYNNKIEKMNYYKPLVREIEKCSNILLNSYNDSQKIAIIYDYCGGTNAAHNGSLMQLTPEKILNYADKKDRYSRGRIIEGVDSARIINFSVCAQQFDIYESNYVVSKEYLLTQLQNDQDAYSEQAQQFLKQRAEQDRQRAEQDRQLQQELRQQYMQHIYKNSPRGICESHCNNNYKKNTSTWNICVSNCKDLRSDILAE